MTFSSPILLARAYDYEHYLCALVAPEEHREALATLVAFAGELSRIPYNVSEPMLGMIRFAWWREALDEIYTGKAARKHEITEPLAEIITRYNLPRHYFDCMIEGYEQLLESPAIADLQALLLYAERTSASLLLLFGEVLGTKHEAIKHIGIAWGIIDVVISVAYQMGHKKPLLPSHLQEKYKFSFDSLCATQRTHGLSLAVEELCLIAAQELADARKLNYALAGLPKPIIFMALITGFYAQKLKKSKIDVCNFKRQSKRLELQLRVLFWDLRKLEKF